MSWKTNLTVLAMVTVLAAPVIAQPALKINGVTISTGQLNIAKYKVTSDTPMLADDAAKAMHVAVGQIIADAVLADAAREAGLSVTPKQVNQGLEAVKAQLGGRTAYQDLLKKLGATEDDVVQLATRRQLAKLYLVTKVDPTVKATEAEAKAYYDTHKEDFRHFDQVKVRGVFVSAPPGIDAKADGAAKARAAEAQRRILAGEDFGKVARSMSDDMSKASGGEMGWMDASFLSSIAAQLGADVSKLEAGDTSDVLRGKFGYWVIQVTDTRPAGPIPFDEVRDLATRRFREAKVDAALAAIVKERRAKATIEALDPAVKAAL